MKLTKKIALSALMMSIYIVTMFFTQGFAFGQFQIRIATALYGLGYFYPFLIVPLGLANLLSNTIMGGLGIYDMIGGMIVGMITTGLAAFIRRRELTPWLIALPIIFVPGLIVPIWLSYLIQVPYKALAISICIGQVVPGVVGALFVKRLKNIL